MVGAENQAGFQNEGTTFRMRFKFANSRQGNCNSVKTIIVASDEPLPLLNDGARYRDLGLLLVISKDDEGDTASGLTSLPSVSPVVFHICLSIMKFTS